jgi:hypothetical protein
VGIVGDEIKQDVGIDQRHVSPRVSAMISWGAYYRRA